MDNNSGNTEPRKYVHNPFLLAVAFIMLGQMWINQVSGLRIVFLTTIILGCLLGVFGPSLSFRKIGIALVSMSFASLFILMLKDYSNPLHQLVFLASACIALVLAAVQLIGLARILSRRKPSVPTDGYV